MKNLKFEVYYETEVKENLKKEDLAIIISELTMENEKKERFLIPVELEKFEITDVQEGEEEGYNHMLCKAIVKVLPSNENNLSNEDISDLYLEDDNAVIVYEENGKKQEVSFLAYHFEDGYFYPVIQKEEDDCYYVITLNQNDYDRDFVLRDIINEVDWESRDKQDEALTYKAIEKCQAFKKLLKYLTDARYSFSFRPEKIR